jgi:hypothetical protein
MPVSEKIRDLGAKELLSDDVIREVVAEGGLEGTTKSLDLEQSLEILGRKNDVWMSFEGWYETLGTGERRYMDLILQAAATGLEPASEETTRGVAMLDDEALEAIAEGDDLDDPMAFGPVSTAVTREIIRRTIRTRCATRWAGC